MDRIRVGVIGTGRFGRIHARNLAALPQCELVGVNDLLEERGKAAAGESGTVFFPDQEALIRAADALFITAATVAHAPLAARCLSSGKHVFLEKPMAVNAAEAAPLCALARESRVKFQVGHIERFNPAFLALAALERTAPPVMESARCSPYHPRGTDMSVVHDLMIHDIDLVLRLAGSAVSSVSAQGKKVFSSTPDICTAEIRFRDGARATLLADRVSEKRVRTLAFSSGGERRVADLDGAQNILKNEIESFLASVLADKPVVVTPEEGLQALELADRILTLCG